MSLYRDTFDTRDNARMLKTRVFLSVCRLCWSSTSRLELRSCFFSSGCYRVRRYRHVRNLTRSAGSTNISRCVVSFACHVCGRANLVRLSCVDFSECHVTIIPSHVWHRSQSLSYRDAYLALDSAFAISALPRQHSKVVFFPSSWVTLNAREKERKKKIDIVLMSAVSRCFAGEASAWPADDC